VRNAYKIWVGKPEGLEDNIVMYLREIGWEGMDWVHLRLGTCGGLL
jgi:hypothetical protein